MKFTEFLNEGNTQIIAPGVYSDPDDIPNDKMGVYIDDIKNTYAGSPSFKWEGGIYAQFDDNFGIDFIATGGLDHEDDEEPGTGRRFQTLTGLDKRGIKIKTFNVNDSINVDDLSDDEKKVYDAFKSTVANYTKAELEKILTKAIGEHVENNIDFYDNKIEIADGY